MRTAAAAFVWAFAVGGVVSSCDDPPPRPSADSFCEGGCQGAARCDSSISPDVCYDRCRNDPENRSLADVRPAAAAVVGSCLTQLDCPAILNGSLDACWQRATEQTAPSDHLLAFCHAYAKSLFECGYWFSVEECQAKLTIWTDEFLARLASCMREATCQAADACLEKAFGGA